MLKLYVWPDTLCDYTCGIMFALAHDADEARAIIRKDCGHVGGELDEEPDVYDSPFGMAVWGGG